MGIGGVVVQFRAEVDQARRDIGKLTQSLGGVKGGASGAAGGLSKLGKVGIGALAGATAGLAGGVAVFVDLAKGAIEDATSQEKLAGNLKKATKATKDQIAAVEEWISKQGIAKGVADDKLRPALSRLVHSTQDIRKAQKLASLAMDVAAGTGKDYTTVVAAIAKANDGQIGGLRKLGVTLGDNAINAIALIGVQKRLNVALGEQRVALSEHGEASKEYKRATEKVADIQGKVNALIEEGVDWQGELGDAYKGSAKKAAGTIEGTWERIKLIFGEIGESIGSAALPPLEAFADWFADKKNQQKVEDWIGKVGDWATAIGEDYAGKLQGFVDWLNSGAGKDAIGEFSHDLQSIADGFGNAADGVGAFVSALGDLKAKYDSMPDWIKKLMDFMTQGVWEAPEWLFNNVPGRSPGKDTGGGGSWGDANIGRKYGKNSGTSGNNTDVIRPGSTVNITVNNPKDEKASASIAAAIRAGKYLDTKLTSGQ